MRILGLDTATPRASVALVVDGRVVAQRNYPEKVSPPDKAKRNHAEIIIPLIGEVLQHGGLSSGDLDRVAVSIGPGSFTGVRIGLSTAKGLVFGSAIPVVGISTLLAYATAIAGFDWLCALLDARKKEAYMALFRRESGALQRVTEDAVLPIPAVIEQLAQHTGACGLIGAGAETYGPLIQAALGARVTIVEAPEDFTVAAAVAHLAASAAANSSGVEMAGLIPAYVRPSEAETKLPRAANLSN